MSDPGANSSAPTVVHLDELDEIAVAGVSYRPIRRALGVSSFGINAYSATEPGQRLIERHHEAGTGGGRHEEL